MNRRCSDLVLRTLRSQRRLRVFIDYCKVCARLPARFETQVPPIPRRSLIDYLFMINMNVHTSLNHRQERATTRIKNGRKCLDLPWNEPNSEVWTPAWESVQFVMEVSMIRVHLCSTQRTAVTQNKSMKENKSHVRTCTHVPATGGKQKIHIEPNIIIFISGGVRLVFGVARTL